MTVAVCRLLRSFHDLVVSSTAELRSVPGMGNASMERMVETVLGFPGVEKPRWIATSDWDAPELSVDQVQYAALDAFLSFQLGLKLVAGPVLPNRESVNVGLRYSEEDASDADSGREYGSDSSSGPGYTQKNGSDTGLDHGLKYYGSDSSGHEHSDEKGSESDSGRRYSEDYGQDTYLGRGYGSDSNSHDSGSVEDAW